MGAPLDKSAALAFLGGRSPRSSRTLRALLGSRRGFPPHAFGQACAARFAIPLLKCCWRNFSLHQELRELASLRLTFEGHAFRVRGYPQANRSRRSWSRTRAPRTEDILTAVRSSISDVDVGTGASLDAMRKVGGPALSNGPFLRH